MSVTPTIAASSVDSGIRWSHRDIPLAHAPHLCGRVAWTPPPQSIAVESDLEDQIVHGLLGQSGLIAVMSQPFTLRYWRHGRRHRYTPDLLAVFSRVPRLLTRLGFGRWTVIEVKPAEYLISDFDEIQARLHAVRSALGFAAVCLTESTFPTRRH